MNSTPLFSDQDSLKFLKLAPFLIFIGQLLFFLTQQEMIFSLAFFLCLLLPHFIVLDNILGSKLSKIFFLAMIFAVMAVVVFGLAAFDYVIYIYCVQILHLVVFLFSCLSICILIMSGEMVRNYVRFIAAILSMIYSAVIVLAIYNQDFSVKQLQDLSIIGLNFTIIHSILLIIYYVSLRIINHTRFIPLLFILFFLNISILASSQIYYLFTKEALLNYGAMSLYIFGVLSILLVYLLLQRRSFYDFNRSSLDESMWIFYKIVTMTLASICVTIILNIQSLYDNVLIVGSSSMFIIFALMTLMFPSKNILAFRLICAHITIDLIYRLDCYFSGFQAGGYKMVIWSVSLVSIKIILSMMLMYKVAVASSVQKG